MKGIQLLIVFTFCLLQITLWSQERAIIDKVVGKVGSEIILLSDVEEQMALMQAERGVLPEGARCFILDNLLAQRLLLTQAKLDSIEVGDEEVSAQLDARIDRILRLMGGDIKQFEAYYGRSITEVKSAFREDLKNQILVERMENQIFLEATVTPSEVKNFFDRIPKDSLPYFNSEVELGEIVHYPTANEEEKTSTKEKLEDLRRRIVEDGEDFSELAKTYSDDGSANAGGDLGWAKRGDYVLEFEGTAYNLEKDEISSVIETEFGFHILQLLDRRGNSIRVRHILSKPEITDDDLLRGYNFLDSIKNRVVDSLLPFSLAVKRYSSDKEQSYNNDGRMVNPATGNTFFEIGSLEPEVFFAIDTMNVGEISSPIEFRAPAGETAYRVVWLQARTPPHTANLKQDYSKIRIAALEEKKAQIINEWVIEKIDQTYIEIDSFFKDCPDIEKWNPRK